MTTDPLLLLLSFIVGVISAFYGVAVGGGALLTVPALIFMGLPASHAVATSRLGSLGVITSGLINFNRKDKVDWALGAKMTVLISIGALPGTYALVNFPITWVEKLIPIIILTMLFLFIFFPSIGLEPQTDKTTSKRRFIGYLLTLTLGFISGFYQGGSGTMAAYIMILFFGQTFVESAATRKVPFLFSNLLILGSLLFTTTIHFDVGIALGLGTFTGGYIGSKIALSRGNRWIRSLFIAIVTISTLRMLFFR